MLLPIQQAAAVAVTSLMQSVIDDAEKRRVEEEEKQRGAGKEDKVLKARIKPDDVTKAANDKINAHFFGAQKRDENPMVVLTARFAAAVGLTRDAGDSNAAFGERLGDAVALTDLVAKKYSDGKPIPIGMGSFDVSVSELKATIDGTAEYSSANARLLARLAVRNGWEPADGEDDMSVKSRIGAALTSMRAELPETVADIEKRAGLRDLGIKASEMVEAIKNPSGDAAQKIKAILDDKAVTANISSDETAKVLQRLEEVAKPKTIEELKDDRQEKDITKVEDAETRSEREVDIKAREAAGKLEDVKKVQEVVEKQNEATDGAEKDNPDGKTGTAVADVALETIQVLAAGAEAIQVQAQADASHPEAPAEAPDPGEEKTKENGAPTDTQQAIMLARAGQEDNAAKSADDTDPLAVSVDENGIYKLLVRKKQDAPLAS